MEVTRNLQEKISTKRAQGEAPDAAAQSIEQTWTVD
jgi:hypothetical protein